MELQATHENSIGWSKTNSIEYRRQNALCNSIIYIFRNVVFRLKITFIYHTEAFNLIRNIHFLRFDNKIVCVSFECCVVDDVAQKESDFGWV